MSGAPARHHHMTRAAAPALEPVVETAVAQSPDAHFDSLVQHCNQRVYRLALRITRNHQDAEDARQETFLKAYRHLDQFEGRSRFTTWISRIAINEGLMNLRKRNDSRRVALDEIAETAIEGDVLVKLRRPIEDPEVNFTRRQLRGALNAAIAALRPLYRDVFVLRTVEELSTSETAKTLGLTVSTVKTRLRRARIELRAYLAACGQMVQNAGVLASEGSSEAA
jgi:RNA polymerase sigma-70 factor (ECF subfamily)